MKLLAILCTLCTLCLASCIDPTRVAASSDTEEAIQRIEADAAQADADRKYREQKALLQSEIDHAKK